MSPWAKEVGANVGGGVTYGILQADSRLVPSLPCSMYSSQYRTDYSTVQRHREGPVMAMANAEYTGYVPMIQLYIQL